MQAVTPVIDKLTIERSTVILAVDMELAAVPVTAHGHYDVQTNAYHATSVTIKTDALNEWSKGTNEELQFFCNALNWDFVATKEAIREAVANR